jgi:LDH2 family malate/lactate/ureidoglycolate dehydrogenase
MSRRSRAPTLSAFTPLPPPAVWRRPAVGTNPIAFGLPSADGPVVFDMGTSAFMLTDAAYRERMGKLLPEGVAIDSTGRPTRDPALARQAAILPFGGYKGFGLAR